MMCYTEDSKCLKVLKVVHCTKGWQSFKDLCDKISNIIVVVLGISPIVLFLGGCKRCRGGGRGMSYDALLEGCHGCT